MKTIQTIIFALFAAAMFAQTETRDTFPCFFEVTERIETAYNHGTGPWVQEGFFHYQAEKKDSIGLRVVRDVRIYSLIDNRRVYWPSVFSKFISGVQDVDSRVRGI